MTISKAASRALDVAQGLHLIHGHREKDPRAYQLFVAEILKLDERGEWEELEFLAETLEVQWDSSESITVAVRMGLTTELREAEEWQ